MKSLPKVVAFLGIIAVVSAVGVFMLRQAGYLSERATMDAGGMAARDLPIVTILPKDAIPAIFEPEFLPATDGGAQLHDDDLVLGVSINGDARAYGVAYLSGHEIVNDTVGGRPIAVTW